MVIKHHFAWLDVLRSVAMLEVLSSHYRNVLLPSYEVIADASKCWVAPLYALTRWGHGAVIIFFVLSGFLVGGKTIERAFRNEFDLKAFIVNRVERIMIPLALMCLIVPLAFLWLNIPFKWWCVIGNLFSLQGLICPPLLGPWWALSIEVRFYIFCGAGLGIWRCSGLARLISGIIFLTVLVVFAYDSFCYLLIWLCGAAMYFLSTNEKSVVRGILSTALAGTLMAISSKIVESVMIADFILGLGVCVAVREVAWREPRRPIAKLINKVGTLLSRSSYSVYLSHMLLMVVLANVVFTPAANATVDREYMVGKGLFDSFTRVGWTEVLWYLFSLVAAFAFGWVIYSIAEKPWWKRLSTARETIRV